jgi:hypothetical protein
MSTTKRDPSATPADDSPKKAAPANTFEGKILTLLGNKLSMRNSEGKEYYHTLAKDVRLTCDGADCEAEDLQVGDVVRVTLRKEERYVAASIEALQKNSTFLHRPG